MPTPYRIADEPTPSGLAKLVVNPVWPLFGLMFGGAWLAWPWFALNAVALGSATRRAELWTLAAGALVSLLLAAGLLASGATGVLPRAALPYAFLLLTIVKLGVAYRLHAWQARSFEIYAYYGGAAQNGLPLLVLGFLGRRLLDDLGNPLWLLVLA